MSHGKVYTLKVQQEIERNMDAIHRPLSKALGSMLQDFVNTPMSPGGLVPHTYAAVREFLEVYVPELMRGHCACGDRCSHCCHQAVTISRFEAEAIGRYIGRKPRNAAYNIDFDIENVESFKTAIQEQHKGVRCPFLGGDGACTIYRIRPLACMMLYNVSNTSSLCADKEGYTPALNFESLEMLLASVSLDMPFADIRDFFPNTDKE